MKNASLWTFMGPPKKAFFGGKVVQAHHKRARALVGKCLAGAGLGVQTRAMLLCCNPKFHLVGGIPTPLKNMKVNWDDYSQYMENKKCSKPPTSKVSLFLSVDMSLHQM